jgi:proteasome beta subunit
VTEEKYVSTGSGSPIVYGVLESQLKDGLTVKDTLPIVVKAVVSAMKRDAASGDSFDVAIISSKGYKELTEEEKKSITEAKV